MHVRLVAISPVVEVPMLRRGAYAMVMMTGLSGCGGEKHPSTSTHAAASGEEPTAVPAVPTGPSVRVTGRALIAGVPPHQGIILSLAFFEVQATSDGPPYGGDPPAEAITDDVQLIEDVDLERAESASTTIEVPFQIQHRPGVFYIQVRALLFRKVDGRVLAQSEQFFFRKRPLELSTDLEGLDLPVTWPSTSVDALHNFGTVEPRGR